MYVTRDHHAEWDKPSSKGKSSTYSSSFVELEQNDDEEEDNADGIWMYMGDCL
jgi:hypothetical protein